MLQKLLLYDGSSASSNDNDEGNEGGYTTVMFYNAIKNDESDGSSSSDIKSNMSESDNGEGDTQELLNIPRGLMNKDRFITGDIENSFSSISDEESYSDNEESYGDDELMMNVLRMNTMDDIVKNSGDFKVLPDEDVLHIFKYLDSDTLGRVSYTCKRFHDVKKLLPKNIYFMRRISAIRIFNSFKKTI